MTYISPEIQFGTGVTACAKPPLMCLCAHLGNHLKSNAYLSWKGTSYFFTCNERRGTHTSKKCDNPAKRRYELGYYI